MSYSGKHAPPVQMHRSSSRHSSSVSCSHWTLHAPTWCAAPSLGLITLARKASSASGVSGHGARPTRDQHFSSYHSHSNFPEHAASSVSSLSHVASQPVVPGYVCVK